MLKITLLLLCLGYVIFYIAANYSISMSRKPDFVKDDNFITRNTTDFRAHKRKSLKETLKLWKTCPKQDGSLDSIIVSVHVDRSGLGNQVWAYLSVWALARRFDVRPAMPEYTLNRLSKMFERREMNIPSVRTLALRCELMPWLLDQQRYSPHVLRKPKEIFRELKVPRKENVTLINAAVYTVDAYFTVPMWNELTNDLVIRKDLREQADQILREIRKIFLYSLKMTDKYKHRNLKMEEIEFVSVHVRRVRYERHLKAVYKNVTIVGKDFYQHSMNWLKKQVNSTLVFIVISDDPKWATENIAKDKDDVFMPGTSEIREPYHDMALLAACNHSIFAYGTYALTGALFAKGGYTIVYDIGNKTVTKEMQYASALPHWYIMDSKGKLQYEHKIIDLTMRA